MKKTCTILLVTYFIISAGTGLSQDGHPLPFLEQWNLGTFETNNWLPEGENWSINWQQGQPFPSAEFTWDPIQTDYEVILESYPLLADSITEGTIYLDFDLKLENYLLTATEFMLVQVWNWNIQEWSTVSTYSNIDGSFDWISEHLDITDLAMNNVFKIRFAATGANSLNIIGWYVDNIHVYRECKAPYNLTVQAINNSQGYGFLLEWENPAPITGWLEWDDGVNMTSIGTGQEIEFDAAARWTPSQLTQYSGAFVDRVAFFPTEPSGEYRIRIWIGAGAANMVTDQLVENPIIGQWNEIALNYPVDVDITQELWVGYYVNAEAGYPAGVDNGPAIDGYGNMMNFGGWQTLLEINPGLNFNWNIKAFFNGENFDTVSKYAVYRSNDGEPYFFRAYTEEENFLDETDLCEFSQIVCFYVTAIYAGETDSCESGPSNESCELCPGMYENTNTAEIYIYPNPASDVLFIESAEVIQRVSIFDSRGTQLELWNPGTLEREEGGQVAGWSGGRVELPLAGLAPGLYFVRVETGSGMVGRKVVIR